MLQYCLRIVTLAKFNFKNLLKMNWFEQKVVILLQIFILSRTYEQLTIDKRRFFNDTRTRSRSPTVDKGRRCY